MATHSWLLRGLTMPEGREEAERAVTLAIYVSYLCQGGLRYGNLESECRSDASAALDALAPFVVFRSELEQITTADGLACWTHDGGGVEWNGQAVYWIREGRE